MTSAIQRAQAQIRKGATVLFAHEVYVRPTLPNCQKLAQRLGVPVILKTPQQRLASDVRACFRRNGVKAGGAAVRWFVRQIKYAATYLRPDGTSVPCFVLDEYAEDILLAAYFDKTAHDEALYNEAGVRVYLEELEALEAEARAAPLAAKRA